MNYFSKVREGKNEWYLYVIGFVLTILGYVLGQMPLFLVAKLYSEDFPDSTNALNTAVADNDFESLGMSNNLTFFLMLCMFFGATAVLWLAVKYLHQKNFIHLITPDAKIDINRIFFGFGIWFIAGLVVELGTNWMGASSLTLQFDPGKFFVLFLIALFFLPIQTSFEEFFVRGYLMQGLALLFKNKVVLMVLSSFLFASLHLMNPEIEKYGMGIMLTYYILAGAVLALFTIMDGRLELALGIHFATNFYGTTVSTYEGSVLQTDALYRGAEINPYLNVLVLVIMSTLFYIFASKIYGWRKISYIFEPVVTEEEEVNGAKEIDKLKDINNDGE